MTNHTVSSRVSRDIVNLLVERGMTLTQIAKSIGVTKSFISRAKAGTRNFTLDHLARLERACGEPLPWLLIKAIPLETVSPENRLLYRATLKLLKPTESRTSRRKKTAA